MLNKKGDMTTKEIMEIILGGAAVLLLLVLLYNLISPDFDAGDETARAYFDSLEEQIAVADSDGTGFFSIWLPSDEGGKREFFLVYFGNHSSYGASKKRFYSLGENLNHICICSWEDGVDRCSYCKNLELPVSHRANEAPAPWAVASQVSLRITKKEDRYEFLTV